MLPLHTTLTQYGVPTGLPEALPAAVPSAVRVPVQSTLFVISIATLAAEGVGPVRMITPARALLPPVGMPVTRATMLPPPTIG